MPPKKKKDVENIQQQIDEKNKKEEILKKFMDIIQKYNINENNPSQIDNKIIEKINNLYLNNVIDDKEEDDIYLEYLGLYHRHVTKNDNDMAMCFLLASQKGNDNAMTYLGDYYKLCKNYDDMKKYYLEAIEMENVLAMVNLGYYYQQKKKYDDMKKYYDMAIKLKNGLAMNNMGNYYFNLNNLEEARKYYLMAIKHGCKKAYGNLARILEKQKIYNYMMRCYEKGVESGDISCMVKLGYYHQFTTKNYTEMMRCYHLAIEKGEAVAMNNMGVYYNNVERNNYNALRYYNMAIEKGNTLAMNNLAKYYGHYNIVDMIKFYTMSANKGNTEAMLRLAEHYEKTLTTNYPPINQEQKNKYIYDTIKWYSLAIINKNDSAISKLEAFKTKYKDAIYNEAQMNIEINNIVKNTPLEENEI